MNIDIFNVKGVFYPKNIHNIYITITMRIIIIILLIEEQES